MRTGVSRTPSRREREEGRSTPRCKRWILPLEVDTPIDSASFIPSSAMKRTKEADWALRASRFLARMSPRWAVKLQGTPDIVLAIIARVDVVDAQWA